jgi:hypothetical protein
MPPVPVGDIKVLARRAYVELTRDVVRERSLESGHYCEIKAGYEALRATYGWTTTGQFDVDAMIAELDALIAATKTETGSKPEPSGESAQAQ